MLLLYRVDAMPVLRSRTMVCTVRRVSPRFHIASFDDGHFGSPAINNVDERYVLDEYYLVSMIHSDE